jgi:hypothetical protein
MVRRPTGCRRLRPLKAHLSQIERIDKHVDQASRVDMPQRSSCGLSGGLGSCSPSWKKKSQGTPNYQGE